jgi:long-chain acyl-CoA synthetase
VSDPTGTDERWIFDVDACLVDSLTGTSLRPGARELLEHLRGTSKTIVWWSAGGDDYAQQRAEQLGVAHLVDAFYAKVERDASGRYVADHVVSGSASVVFVDDRPEDMPHGAVVVAVSPYLAHNPHDRGLADAARRAGVEG